MCLRFHTQKNDNVYIYVHIYMYIYMYDLYMYIYMYMYIYVYICIYIHKFAMYCASISFACVCTGRHSRCKLYFILISCIPEQAHHFNFIHWALRDLPLSGVWKCVFSTEERWQSPFGWILIFWRLLTSCTQPSKQPLHVRGHWQPCAVCGLFGPLIFQLCWVRIQMVQYVCDVPNSCLKRDHYYFFIYIHIHIHIYIYICIYIYVYMYIYI